MTNTNSDWLAIALAVLSFATILIAGLKTDLLRERPGMDAPYSFRKFQLWIWTLIIAPGFCLNWGFGIAPEGTTLPYLNNTALILLGISAATTLTAEMVSSTGVSTNASLAANNQPAVPLKVNSARTQFWNDILKDDSGQLSVVRLQQLIFTFAYAGIYIAMFSAKNENGQMLFAYPEFGSNAFVLMGISAGTYVVGKGLRK